MNLPSIDTTGTMVGIIALVVLELDKRRLARQKDERWQNGSNPVVNAIKELSVVVSTENQSTRAKIVEVFAAVDKRQEEHQAREERQLENLAREIREHRP